MQRQLYIASQTTGSMNGFAQLGAIHIDMDDLGICCKFGTVAGNPIIEPNAQGDNQVCIVHCHGGCVMSVHTLHSQESGMICGNTGKAH